MSMRATRVYAPTRLMILWEKIHTIWNARQTKFISVECVWMELISCLRKILFCYKRSYVWGRSCSFNWYQYTYAHSSCICLFNFIPFFQNPLTIPLFLFEDSFVMFSRSAAHEEGCKRRKSEIERKDIFRTTLKVDHALVAADFINGLGIWMNS